MKKKLKSLYRFLSPNFQTTHFEYKTDVKPRYGHGKKAHPALYKIIDQNRGEYYNHLKNFLNFSEKLQEIQPQEKETNENEPTWNNGFLPGLDIVGIYGMIASFKPASYIEIGSGNSTKVARKAIEDNELDTKITSIDPFPRANIDHLADQVIREPFENLKDTQFILESLKENDILFIDNSHRVFPNSDATVFFMEILPFLKKGVIVHVHDIYLPFDYPQFMCDRFYNEQYLLAAFLLANPHKYHVILPNFFISEDDELSNQIAPVWNADNLRDVEKHGGSFWVQIK